MSERPYKVVPLLHIPQTTSNGHVTLHRDFLTAIADTQFRTKKIQNVIAFLGPSRAGKSRIASNYVRAKAHLPADREVFASSPSTEPCTAGIDVCFVTLEGDSILVVLDAQGADLGSTSFNKLMYGLVMWMATTMIFVVNEIVNHHSLDSMVESIVARASQATRTPTRWPVAIMVSNKCTLEPSHCEHERIQGVLEDWRRSKADEGDYLALMRALETFTAHVVPFVNSDDRGLQELLFPLFEDVDQQSNVDFLTTRKLEANLVRSEQVLAESNDPLVLDSLVAFMNVILQAYRNDTAFDAETTVAERARRRLENTYITSVMGRWQSILSQRNISPSSITGYEDIGQVRATLVSVKQEILQDRGLQTLLFPLSGPPVEAAITRLDAELTSRITLWVDSHASKNEVVRVSVETKHEETGEVERVHVADIKGGNLFVDSTSSLFQKKQQVKVHSRIVRTHRNGRITYGEWETGPTFYKSLGVDSEHKARPSKLANFVISGIATGGISLITGGVATLAEAIAIGVTSGAATLKTGDIQISPKLPQQDQRPE